MIWKDVKYDDIKENNKNKWNSIQFLNTILQVFESTNTTIIIHYNNNYATNTYTPPSPLLLPDILFDKFWTDFCFEYKQKLN